MLEVAVAESVVDNETGALGVLRRCTDDVHDGNMLGITAGDGVGRRQLADAERRDQGRHPPQPAISVRGVTGVEFIRATDPPHARMGDNVVKEFQLIVAGDPEDLGHPEFSKSIQQVVTNGVASFEDSVHPVDGSTASRTPALRLRCSVCQV